MTEQRSGTALPLSGWNRHEGVTVVECPDCGFCFDADHENMEGRLLSCPLCAELRLRAAIEDLSHDLQPGLLHRKDHPRPDGGLVTYGEELPHEPWCVPCYLLGIIDPVLDLRRDA